MKSFPESGMRQLIIVALSSLVITSQALAQHGGTEETLLPETPLTAESMAQNFQNHMFDGIELTEQQRQQMRDLMFQTRQMRTAFVLSDVEKQHQLVIAPEFDEAAARAQAEKMAKIHIDEQISMSRVRHQMYRLLTSRQQEILQKNFEFRMKTLRSSGELP